MLESNDHNSAEDAIQTGASGGNPLLPFIDRQGVVVLDGGLATQLEAYGRNLNDPLWSARLLKDEPGLIKQVHLDYLAVGADCLITASYQATIEGFIRHGLAEEEAVRLLRLSTELALAAREEYWAQAQHRTQRLRPLVAASIGPYGAAQADGSEYTGDYDVGEQALYEFHRRRWRILAASGADLLACETLPSFPEMKALARLLRATPGVYAWFSFTCRDGAHLSDGTELATCGRYLDSLPQVAAIGVNCTAPRFIPDLIRALATVTEKPIIVYPNSGEAYDSQGQRWVGDSVPAEFGTYSREWRKLGAAAIGGCCRTGPEHVRQIRDRFSRAGQGG